MQEPAVCSSSNLRGLYVTQTEARSLVRTWSLLRALGISLEDPLSGAFVARKLFHGGIKLVQVVQVLSEGTSGKLLVLMLLLQLVLKCYVKRRPLHGRLASSIHTASL
jgi:hypothetical protein